MLASFVRRFGVRRTASPPLLREPLRLIAGTTALAVGETRRRDLEIKLGPGVSYPAPGWHTWTVTGTSDEPWLLSAFFRATNLIAVEYYVGKTGNVPKYAPRTRGGRFLLVPGDVGLGHTVRSLPPGYAPSGGRAGSVGSVVYTHAFEARWPGGVALLAGNDGRIERIALYGGAS